MSQTAFTKAMRFQIEGIRLYPLRMTPGRHSTRPVDCLTRLLQRLHNPVNDRRDKNIG